MTQDMHTCSSACPCHTGGTPRPDFVTATAEIQAMRTIIEGWEQALRRIRTNIEAFQANGGWSNAEKENRQ